MKALRHLAGRLWWALLVIAGVGTLSFFIARKLPGDPTRMLVGPQASAADVAMARRVYGLDRGAVGQYLTFWRRLLHPDRGGPEAEHRSCAELGAGLHLDLGFSYRYRQPVAKLIAVRAPRTLKLALAAMLVQILIGLGVGVVAARRRGSMVDQAAIGAVLLGVCAPIFVLGLALQYLFAHKLGWLPHDGFGDTPGAELRSLVLPALTLGLYGSALYARLARAEIGEALGADYIRTARAKGAGELRVTLVHALRNALLPIVTLMVLDFGALVGGAIVSEKLFRWPGMGAMTVDAMVNRDAPVIFGTVLFSAAAVVAATLALDVVLVALDPRLRGRTRE